MYSCILCTFIKTLDTCNLILQKRNTSNFIVFIKSVGTNVTKTAIKPITIRKQTLLINSQIQKNQQKKVKCLMFKAYRLNKD